MWVIISAVIKCKLWCQIPGLNPCSSIYSDILGWGFISLGFSLLLCKNGEILNELIHENCLEEYLHLLKVTSLLLKLHKWLLLLLNTA